MAARRPLLVLAGAGAVLLAAFGIRDGWLVPRADDGATRTGADGPAALRPPVDVDKLIEFHRARVARDPEDFISHAALGAIFVEKARETGDGRNYELAEAHAKEALRLLPAPDAPARLVLARVALARHRFRDAIRIAEEAARGRPRQPAAVCVIVDAALATGDRDGAAAALGRLLALDRSPAVIAREAALHRLDGRPEAALAAWEEAIRRDEGRARETSAWLRVSMAELLIERGEVEEARRRCEDALASFPGYWRAEWRLGDLDAADGRLEAAAQRYGRATAGARHPVILASWAEVEARRGRAAEAERLAAEAEGIFRADAASPDPGHRTELARWLLTRARPGDAKEALALVEEEAKVRKDPDTLSTLQWARDAAAGR